MFGLGVRGVIVVCATLAVACGSDRRDPLFHSGGAGSGGSANPGVGGQSGGAGQSGGGSAGSSGTGEPSQSGQAGEGGLGGEDGPGGPTPGGGAGVSGGGPALECAVCLIDDTCYPNGVGNPSNGCEVCDPARSATAFSDGDGAACDDGIFCNGRDTCAAGACEVHSGDPCSDDVSCNGVEHCVEVDARCAPGATTCEAGQICDVRADTCTLTCAGCVVGTVCYPDNAHNPLNACEVCDTARSRNAFSPRSGTACDDGVFCNGLDTCSNGACTTHGGSPCSDGVICNGEEQCIESSARCAPGTMTCDAGQVCNAATDACVPTCAGCLISGVCYPNGTTNPDNPCEMCDTARSVSDFSGADGHACNDGVFCNGPDRCADRHCINHAGTPCGSNMTCSEPAQRCCAPGDGSCGCRRGETGPSCERCLIHVNGASGADANDGADWSSAKKTLEAALEAADANDCDVWVAAGTYVPRLRSDPTDPYSVAFQLRPGVTLYGGFSGTETRLEQRRPTLQRTILSGELGEPSSSDDNAYHVVRGVTGATLDGFVVRAGSARRLEDFYGGGMLNVDASPLVRQCVFEDNLAGFGAAIANFGTATVRIEQCVFRGNESFQSGGAVHSAARQTRIVRSAFVDNTASNEGGALNGGDWFIESSIFLNNRSRGTGSAIVVTLRSGATIDNCTFSGNGSTPALFANDRISVRNSVFWNNAEPPILGAGFTVDVSYCDVQGGYPGIGNIDANPLFMRNPATVPLDVGLMPGSPCIDAASGGESTSDFLGSSRRDDPQVPNVNGFSTDIGALEHLP